MDTEHTFVRDEVLPSWWANALGKFLSVGAFNFLLSKTDDTHLAVPAGAGVDAAAIAVEGLWRFVEAPASRAHPGGAAGAYDVYVTAKANDIQSSPAPYTDDTDYSFALWIGAAGATPPIVAGSVDVIRRVGSCQWDGVKITRVDQLVPVVGPHAETHRAGGSDPLVAVVTALPAAPVDGQEIYFVADAANGILWHLRYNAGSASAHKWEFLGGSSLHAEVDAAQATASGLWADLATVGPSIAIPLDGDYDVSWSAQIEADSSGAVAGVGGFMGVDVGFGASSDWQVGGRVDAAKSTVNGVLQLVLGDGITRRLALLAAHSAVAKYRLQSVADAPCTFSFRTLDLRPVRVG